MSDEEDDIQTGQGATGDTGDSTEETTGDTGDNTEGTTGDNGDSTEETVDSVAIGTVHPAHKVSRPEPEPEPYTGYPSNNEALRKILLPRNYHDTSLTLRHDLQVMLRDHPEAFDCLVYPALESEKNEFVTVDGPRVGIADRDERAQEYGEPVQARAYLVPDPSLEFMAVDSALYESITGTQPPVNILLSVAGIRTYSLIQWLEYLKPDMCDTIERTYYVAEVKPLGRTLNAEMIYVCYPLPALGETPLLWRPEYDEDEEEEGGTEEGDGDTEDMAGDTEDGTGDAEDEEDATDSGIDGIKIGEV